MEQEDYEYIKKAITEIEQICKELRQIQRRNGGESQLTPLRGGYGLRFLNNSQKNNN